MRSMIPTQLVAGTERHVPQLAAVTIGSENSFNEVHQLVNGFAPRTVQAQALQEGRGNVRQPSEIDHAIGNRLC